MQMDSWAAWVTDMQLYVDIQLQYLHCVHVSVLWPTFHISINYELVSDRYTHIHVCITYLVIQICKILSVCLNGICSAAGTILLPLLSLSLSLSLSPPSPSLPPSPSFPLSSPSSHNYSLPCAQSSCLQSNKHWSYQLSKAGSVDSINLIGSTVPEVMVVECAPWEAHTLSCLIVLKQPLNLKRKKYTSKS